MHQEAQIQRLLTLTNLQTFPNKLCADEESSCNKNKTHGNICFRLDNNSMSSIQPDSSKEEETTAPLPASGRFSESEKQILFSMIKQDADLFRAFVHQLTKGKWDGKSWMNEISKRFNELVPEKRKSDAIRHHMKLRRQKDCLDEKDDKQILISLVRHSMQCGRPDQCARCFQLHRFRVKLGYASCGLTACKFCDATKPYVLNPFDPFALLGQLARGDENEQLSLQKNESPSSPNETVNGSIDGPKQNPVTDDLLTLTTMTLSPSWNKFGIFHQKNERSQLPSPVSLDLLFKHLMFQSILETRIQQQQQQTTPPSLFTRMGSLPVRSQTLLEASQLQYQQQHLNRQNFLEESLPMSNKGQFALPSFLDLPPNPPSTSRLHSQTTAKSLSAVRRKLEETRESASSFGSFRAAKRQKTYTLAIHS